LQAVDLQAASSLPVRAAARRQPARNFQELIQTAKALLTPSNTVLTVTTSMPGDPEILVGASSHQHAVEGRQRFSGFSS
jgi:hypothetical protein